MQVRVYGKNIDLGDSLRSNIELKIENIVEKYLNTITDASATVIKDHRIFKVEIVLLVTKGFWINGCGSSDDPYKALDFAIAKLEVLIKKHKNKLADVTQRARWVEHGYAAVDKTLDQTQDNTEPDKIIIAEQEKYVLLLSVSEAVAKLELGDLPVVMFKNAENQHINVVYKRPDGHYGWIDYSD